MTTSAFIDLETTGLDPQLHEPWEIAVIVEDHADPGLNGEWCWQVRPDLTSADPGALKVGRYWERLHARLGATAPGAGLMLATHDDDLHPGVAVNAAEIADRLAGLLTDAELVGVNVQFDAAFLAEFLRRHHQAPSWDYHLTELCSMARGWLHGGSHLGTITGDYLSRRSDDLSRLCGVPVPSDEERHTALGDARWVQRWYHALTTPPAAERIEPHPTQADLEATLAVARDFGLVGPRLAANETTALAELEAAQQQTLHRAGDLQVALTVADWLGRHTVSVDGHGTASVGQGEQGWAWSCDGWTDCDGQLSSGWPTSGSADKAARRHLQNAHQAEIDQAQQEVRG